MSAAEVLPELELPHPTGANILVHLRRLPEKTKGGIILAKEVIENDAYKSLLGRVVDMGGDCYRGAEGAFPSGPYCRPGNWVMFGKYVGQRFQIGGEDYRMIRDTDVIATIDNPESVAY